VSRPLQIAVTISLRTHYGRQMLVGISEYANQHGLWDLRIVNSFLGPQAVPGALEGDGIIASIDGPELHRELPRPNVPTVNVSWTYELHNIPTVVSDNLEVGRIAAEHLLARGFDNLAYCGDSSYAFSVLRHAGFAEAVDRAGMAIHVHDCPHPHDSRTWQDWCQDICGWLISLPKPLGLMAFTDSHAWRVQQACRLAGLSMPDQVAMLGVNNDELIGSMCSPPLSSVELGIKRVGYSAASLLETVMQNTELPACPVLIPPAGVVVRDSSGAMAGQDPQMAKALRFIRRNAIGPLRVEDVLDELTISRRSLERRFLRHLGHSPHEEITRARLDHVKRLLLETDMSVTDIAMSSGFGSLKYFYKVFKARTGMTPVGLRRSCSPVL